MSLAGAAFIWSLFNWALKKWEHDDQCEHHRTHDWSSTKANVLYHTARHPLSCDKSIQTRARIEFPTTSCFFVSKQLPWAPEDILFAAHLVANTERIPLVRTVKNLTPMPGLIDIGKMTRSETRNQFFAHAQHLSCPFLHFTLQGAHMSKQRKKYIRSVSVTSPNRRSS